MSARVIFWPAFFMGVLIAWLALWAMGQEMRGYSVYGAEFWAMLCQSDAGDIAVLPLFAMWSVMSVAMMAPTFVPALHSFVNLPKPAGQPHEAGAMIAGYLVVWLGGSVMFAGVQYWLSRAGLLAPDGQSLSWLLVAVLFLMAGLYQFSNLKEACLTRCRSPMTLFITHWRPGLRPAFMLGARIGVDCLGCCWALMLLAFVGGMTNLLWMGLATVIMVLEKLPDIGRPLTRPLGWGLLAIGIGCGGLAIGGGL